MLVASAKHVYSGHDNDYNQHIEKANTVVPSRIVSEAVT
jgi:hypothetical protein